MREILFRGKRKTNGEWIYGDYFRSKISNTELGIRVVHSITFFEDDEEHSYCVDPDTIGQYTGLTDKKIFEGDIVTGLFLYSEPVSGVCVFKDGSFGIEWNRGKVKEFSAFTSICNVTYEVIGNIYDNPELLGVEK